MPYETYIWVVRRQTEIVYERNGRCVIELRFNVYSYRKRRLTLPVASRRVGSGFGTHNALTPGCYTPPWFCTLLPWQIAFFYNSYQRSALGSWN